MKQDKQDPHEIAKNIGFMRTIYNIAKKCFKLSCNSFSDS